MTAPATAILSVLVLAAADVSTETRTVTAGRPEYGRHSSFWRFHFGEGYRDLWTTPFEVEVLDLRTHKGGLTPVRQVGSMQSIGLALRGGDGRSYTFRTLASCANGRPTGANEFYQQNFAGPNTTGPETHPNIHECVPFHQCRDLGGLAQTDLQREQPARPEASGCAAHDLADHGQPVGTAKESHVRLPVNDLRRKLRPLCLRHVRRIRHDRVEPLTGRHGRERRTELQIEARLEARPLRIPTADLDRLGRHVHADEARERPLGEQR